MRSTCHLWFIWLVFECSEQACFSLHKLLFLDAINYHYSECLPNLGVYKGHQYIPLTDPINSNLLDSH